MKELDQASGLNIKSMIGEIATLFNAGKGTNFPYEYDAEFHDGKPTGLVAYTYHLPEGDLVWEKERIWRHD